MIPINKIKTGNVCALKVIKKSKWYSKLVGLFCKGIFHWIFIVTEREVYHQTPFGDKHDINFSFPALSTEAELHFFTIKNSNKIITINVEKRVGEVFKGKRLRRKILRKLKENSIDHALTKPAYEHALDMARVLVQFKYDWLAIFSFGLLHWNLHFHCTEFVFYCWAYAYTILNKKNIIDYFQYPQEVYEDDDIRELNKKEVKNESS